MRAALCCGFFLRSLRVISPMQHFAGTWVYVWMCRCAYAHALLRCSDFFFSAWGCSRLFIQSSLMPPRRTEAARLTCLMYGAACCWAKKCRPPWDKNAPFGREWCDGESPPETPAETHNLFLQQWNIHIIVPCAKISLCAGIAGPQRVRLRMARDSSLWMSIILARKMSLFCSRWEWLMRHKAVFNLFELTKQIAILEKKS